MATALIALGSNVGDPLANLKQAIAEMRSHLHVAAVSHVYRTAPMYVEDQAEFHNAAVRAETELGPLPLLRILKDLEHKVGRRVREQYGPREIDLDLIAYGTLLYTFCDQGKLVLTVPHPRTTERRFVLQPLADVAPDFTLPGLGKVADLLAATESQAASVHRQDGELPL